MNVATGIAAVMGVLMYAVANVVERRMTGWATRGMDGGASAPGG